MSSAFYPQGMNSYNNRSLQEGYRSWKGSDNFVNPTGITSGNIRPFTNNDPTNTSNPGFGLPRPIKHYRRGTSINGTNNRQVRSSTSNMVSQMMDTPGGYVVKSDSSKADVCDTFSGINLVSNYYPFQNLTEKPQPGKFSCDGEGHMIGNQETKAVNRARGANTIIKKNYYTRSSEMLYNRCATFNQNEFNFKSKVDDNTFYANCSGQPNECKTVTYKPNNSTFSKQGAVSSSTRLLKLQQNTTDIANRNNKNAPKNTVCKKSFIYRY